MQHYFGFRIYQLSSQLYKKVYSTGPLIFLIYLYVYLGIDKNRSLRLSVQVKNRESLGWDFGLQILFSIPYLVSDDSNSCSQTLQMKLLGLYIMPEQSQSSVLLRLLWMLKPRFISSNCSKDFEILEMTLLHLEMSFR